MTILMRTAKTAVVIPAMARTPARAKRVEPWIPNQLPDTSIHPVTVAIPLACAAWFVLVSWAAFAGGETSLLLAVVTLICLIFLGLLTFAGALSRDMTPERAHGRSFRAFLDGQVDIETGPTSGRQALVQIAAMPVALTLGATAIALIATSF